MKLDPVDKAFVVLALFLLLLSLLFGCGVSVSGEVKHTVALELDNVEKYFLAKCQKANDPDPELCAKAAVGEFLSEVLK